jgi:F-type H+-transporting ATPase subunit gamma
VTRRQDLERHRHSLGEVRNIMNSMKTLAYMETRKLARYFRAENAVVESLETVAADFIAFHAETVPEAETALQVYLVIGTERGFCGDFNQALIHRLESEHDEQAAGEPILVVVGRKLFSLLENDPRVTARIDGASVVEEVIDVLEQVVHELSSLHRQHGVLKVHALYHNDIEGIVVQQLLPPFQHLLHQASRYTNEPLLNLKPAEFLVELTEHYLFSVLLSILYLSLDSENHHRVSHLENAIRHLDEESEELTRKCNTLRQEDIIEEIEVILLSAGLLEDIGQKQKPSGDDQ